MGEDTERHGRDVLVGFIFIGEREMKDGPHVARRSMMTFEELICTAFDP
jgi:hypothetical protein